jgi:hypothetical protein
MHLDFTNGIFDVRPSAARPDGGPSVTVKP